MLKFVIPAIALVFVAACSPMHHGAPHCHCCEQCDCHQPEHTGASCDCTSCNHGTSCAKCDGKANDAQKTGKPCKICDEAERKQGYRR